MASHDVNQVGLGAARDLQAIERSSADLLLFIIALSLLANYDALVHRSFPSHFQSIVNYSHSMVAGGLDVMS